MEDKQQDQPVEPPKTNQSMPVSEYESILKVLQTITQTGIRANNHFEALSIVSSILNMNLHGSLASDAFLNALKAIVQKGMLSDSRSAMIIVDNILRMKMPTDVQATAPPTTTAAPEVPKAPDTPALPPPLVSAPETPVLPAPQTPSAALPAPGTPASLGVPAPGTPAADVSGLQLALLPQRTMANSATHPTQYGQFRRFCERNHESCKSVVNAWKSLPECNQQLCT